MKGRMFIRSYIPKFIIENQNRISSASFGNQCRAVFLAFACVNIKLIFSSDMHVIDSCNDNGGT